jgi:predicted ATPase
MEKRYHLERTLGKGGMGEVFIAQDRLERTWVALKRVHIPQELQDDLSPAVRDGLLLSLAQEFRLLATLRHPNIISVMDYGFDPRQQPYYTMELLQGATHILKAASGRTVAQKVGLLMQLTRALIYLHRRGILHRDLKPANILVHQNQVKLLDFGLALARGQLSTETVGTVAYMAPELMRSNPASERSDLYAVGVIMYEMFAGRHPFDRSSVNKLLEQIINAAPDLSALRAPDAIIKIIAVLLNKDPFARFPNATALLNALGGAIGQPVQLDAFGARESFLRAASFVGRDEELGRLKRALTRTMESRQGGGWLIAGESGVGKSRLMEELRVQGLVAGVVALRGQSFMERAAPYATWRDTLRSLCLLVEVTDDEAGVILPLVPDVDQLIGRPVTPPPELDPAATKARLFNIIEGIFTKLTQPSLLLLEDVHWANESLELLRRIVKLAPRIPLMIVATFRDDERPSLPQSLPDMSVIELRRLSENEVADLTASIVGDHVRARNRFVGELYKETDGNVLFLVEVLRALAQETGDLDLIGSKTISGGMFAQGIESVIRQRLNRVPTEMRLRLKLAAVMGRQVDVDVLRLTARTAEEIEQWLVALADAAILAVQANRWQFAHDKLRDALIRELSTDERRQLNEIAAKGLERVYGEAPDLLARLAYHWSEANNTDREYHYRKAAGVQALGNAFYNDAKTQFERAAELAQRLSPLEQAEIFRQIAEAHYGSGDYLKSLESNRLALALLGLPFKLDAQFEKVKRLDLITLPGASPDERRAALLLGARICLRIARTASQSGRYEYLAQALHLGLSALEEVDNADVALTAQHYSQTALLMLFNEQPALADHYAGLTDELAASVTRPVEAANLKITRGLYAATCGKWSAAESLLVSAADELEAAGSLYDAQDAIALHVLLALTLGQWEKANTISERLMNSARQTGRDHATVAGWLGRFEALVGLGRLEDAEIFWWEHRLQFNVPTDHALPLLLLRSGHLDELDGDILEKLTAANRTRSAFNFSALLDFVVECECYLMLWERKQDRAYRAGAKAAIIRLGDYMRVHRFAEVPLLLLRAWFEQLDEKSTDAERDFGRAMDAARRWDMPFYEGGIYLQRARLTTDARLRSDYARRALELFQAHHALWHAGQAQAMLTALLNANTASE